MATEAEMLEAISRDPADDLAWLALADCLEENGESDRAELVRLREWLRKAGVKDPQREPNEARLAALLIAGVKPSVPTWSIDLGDAVKLSFVLIPPGSYWMGSPGGEEGRWDDEGPRHQVTISRPFWLGQTSLTEGQWHRVMKPKQERQRKKQNHPVCHVDFPAARKFCKRLGKQIESTVRLPTEAEWEYACRAATTTSTYLGDGEDRAALAAWYIDNAGRRLHGVAKKVPNAWGLYDMLGNVWNWCDDTTRDFARQKQTDPRGEGDGRAIKGASWKSMGFRCRCASRYRYQDNYSFDDLGVRVLVTS
jgi:uncharacterized protein (TIGR02996 family)